MARPRDALYAWSTPAATRNRSSLRESTLLPRKARDCLSVRKESAVPSINAQRRHAKATKRKKILEERHRLEAQDAGG